MGNKNLSPDRKILMIKFTIDNWSQKTFGLWVGADSFGKPVLIRKTKEQIFCELPHIKEFIQDISKTNLRKTVNESI